MKFEPIISDSGNLTEAGYDAETQKCQIKFKSGGLYEYDCPPELWAEFRATFQTSASSGKFFQARIKSLPTRRIN